MKEQIKYKSRRRTGTTHSGDSYEVDLLLLCKVRGERDTDGFYLDTNVDGVGDFDDIVFKYWNKGESRIILLQAKHKENSSNGKVTIEKFKNPNNDKFYLGKYLLSFLKCKENFKQQSKDPIFQGNFRDLDLKFVIYTNCILDEQFDKNRKIDIGNSIVSTNSRMGKNKAFKFTLDLESKNSDLVEMLERVSCQDKVNLLAKTLISFLCGELNYNNMMSNKFFSIYHVFLSKYVIEVNEEIKKDEKKIEYREGRINLHFFNSEKKHWLMNNFREEVMFQYGKNVVFKEKCSSGLSDRDNQDILVSEVAASLILNKKLDKSLIQKLGGSVILLDAKKRELKFASPEKLKDDSCKQFIRNLENKVSNLDLYTFDIPYEVIKKSLEQELLKLHVGFGNIKPNFKKSKHLINQLIKLFVQYRNHNVIKIEEGMVGDGKVLTYGLLKNIGKFVGNLLVFDEEEKKLRFADKKNLNKNIQEFMNNLKKEAESANLLIDKYKFDIKVMNFPRDTICVDEEDRTNAEEFLSKLEIFTGEASDSELREIIKDEIRSLFNLTAAEVEDNFLKIRNKAENFWRNGNYYLQKGDDFFTKIVRFHIEFDMRHPSDLFVGREEELTLVDALLKNNLDDDKITVISQMASINGLGGIGKSELARKYVYKYRKHYDGNVIWINAENDQTLTQCFHDLSVNKLEISLKDIDGNLKSIKSIVEAVYRFFAGRKSLIVFDNAERSTILETALQVRSLLCRDNKPYILITSREHKEVWEKLGVKEGLQLDVLKEQDAISFVKKALKSDLNTAEDFEIEQIKELSVNTLCKFPLALRQAVAHILEENKKHVRRGNGKYSINDYLKEYKEKKRDLLNSKAFASLNDDYAKTTFTTWKLTIDKIKGDKKYGRQALEILDVIAFFAPDNIPVNIFFSELKPDDEKLWNAVELLNRYSMVKLEQGKIYIHRLVQEVTILNIGDREAEVLNDGLKLFQCGSQQIDLFTDNLRLSYVDHALSVWSYANKYEELVRKFSSLPVLIVSELNATLRYQEAYFCGNEALISLKSILGNNNPCVLAMMKNIATILYNLGEDSHSLEIYRKLMENSEIINKHATKYIFFDVNIGLLLNRQGKYDEALEIFTHLYNLYKIGLIHSDGEIEHNLALTFFHKDKLEDAMDMFKKSFKQKMETLGPEHKSTLNTENSISAVLEMQGKYEEALEITEKVYEGRKKILGPKHPDTLTSFGNIAYLLNKLMKYDEALKIAVEVDKERGELLPNHPRTLKGKFLIVGILASQGKYAESLEKCRSVYEKRKQILGPNHSDTLATLDMWYSLALKFAEQGIHNKALEEFEDLLRERENLSEPSHPEIYKTKKVIKLLRQTLDGGNNINFKRIDQGFLLLATQDGELEVVCELLNKGIDPNGVSSDEDGTPLHFSSQNGHSRIVKKLLEKGANVNAKGKNGSTSLHIAAHRNDLEVVDALLKGNADVDCSDNALFRPLHFAAQEGHIEIIKLLLINGADVDATTIDGMKALDIAANQGNLNVLKILLEGGASINPLENIFIQESIKKLLLSTKQLLDAVKQRQNRSNIQRLLEDGAVINYFSGTDRLTSLHYVVSQGNPDIVKLFLSRKPNVNVADEDGWTPLHYAAQNGDAEIVQMLLDNRADPDILNIDGEKPSHLVQQRLNRYPGIYQMIIDILK